jgi:hypothetical protein
MRTILLLIFATVIGLSLSHQRHAFASSLASVQGADSDRGDSEMEQQIVSQ